MMLKYNQDKELKEFAKIILKRLKIIKISKIIKLFMRYKDQWHC